MAAVSVVARRTRRRRGPIGPSAVALLLLVVAGMGVGKLAEPSPHTRGEITLVAATATGPHPFTASVATGAAPAPAKATTATGSDSGTSPKSAQLITTTPGSHEGLFGGTRSAASCDRRALVTALQGRPDRAAAFALVEGISPGDIGSFVDGLTPVVLRGDTRVTDHGFITDHPSILQSVLESGSAVMVDHYGSPRVRCLSGDPLTPPVRITITPTYLGTRWPGFVSAGVTVVTAAAQPLTSLVLTDTATGQRFRRPVATDGQADADAPAAPPPAS
jgi:hypothetical protein